MSEAEARRVLILDDDALVGMLVESVARLAGMATCLTREADEFYEALDRWQPTHIVLDLTMPGLSGEQVLSELARRGCRARIIVTSGAERDRLDSAMALAQAEGLDVAGVLPKPFVLASLRALLV